MQDGTAFPTVAIAIDKDKGSQIALKWALDHIIFKGQTVTLIHVDTKRSGNQEDAANAMRELFIPFRCFCKRKDKVYCKDVLLEGTDVAKAIIDFVSQEEIEKLVVGASSRGFVRFKTTDVATSVSKGVPDFCTVYVIAKGKVSSVRNARAAPPPSPLRYQIQNKSRLRSHSLEQRFKAIKGEAEHETRSLLGDRDSLRGSHIGTPRSNGDKMAERDICVDSRSSDRSFHQRLSNIADYYDHSFEMMQSTPLTSSSMHHHHHSSLPPSCNDFLSSQEEIETEIRRLRLELKQTMVMYSTACKEALTAKQKAKELQRWKLDEDKRLEEARTAEEAALAIAEKERAKCSAAMEAAEASKRTAEAEAEKRRALEKLKEKETTTRYRRYSIGEIEKATERFAERRKIGEGGYGPVYRCHLDHTPVAVKVLRSDAAQGRSQFQQEVEILSSIRHPNMVLLLGACPEYGCLVYEYMANGSLDDRLFRRGNTPPLPWQHRFRIAAEIATGLLFLHQTKPKPLVHRDLKPANILLDRNYVSKISDVGLSRLVPPTVADSVTQYRVTAAAGTFCYIDPEYQQTGMLGTKSDVYSLGIMLLQLIAGKPPMGIKHWMEKTIEEGKFEELLDPAVPDWPVEEALRFARVSLQCAELRRKDRPDLGTVVLPELNRLRELADENMQHSAVWRGTYNMPLNNQVSLLDIRSGPRIQSEYDSSRSSRSRSGD